MKAETIYAVLLMVVCLVAGMMFAPGRELALADVVLVGAVKTTTFLALGLGFIYVLKGIKYDVLSEVFDEGNTAGAIFTGLVLVAMALVIGK